MELLPLDRTTYRPVGLVDNWDSLIWTERYQQPGDFSLKTHHVAETMTKLPLDSLVALSESEEIMWVENWDLSLDDTGEETLTVSGRSFEVFLENRISIDDYPVYNLPDPATGLSTDDVYAWRLANNNWNDSDCARYIIDRHIVNPVLTNLDGEPETADVVPNLTVWNFDVDGRRPYDRYIERGNLYEAVLKIIQASGAGIRNARPSSNENLLRMVIYRGLDRTTNQTTNSRVIFDWASGHLNNNSYLWSTKDYKNNVHIWPKNGRRMLGVSWPWANPANLRGLDRKTLMVDATEITETAASLIAEPMRNRVYSELGASAIQNVYEFQVSPDNPYVFGTDYRLGDKVTVQGKYGSSRIMVVCEFIRSESDEGIQYYPGLTEDF